MQAKEIISRLNALRHRGKAPEGHLKKSATQAASKALGWGFNSMELYISGKAKIPLARAVEWADKYGHELILVPKKPKAPLL